MLSSDVFLCSPFRSRGGDDDELGAALNSWVDLRPGKIFLAVDGSPPLLPIGVTASYFFLNGTPDSREIGGPRSTGETQENIAFLRNKCFREWDRSRHSWCFMVDSDVVLAPNALNVALFTLTSLMERHDAPCTLSLQIDNRVTEDHAPATNAMDDRGRPIPWADDGRLTEVARSGAVTLYPRRALGFRFGWAPGYNEEHQSMLDQMRSAGWRHYLLQDPRLTDHRMRRLRSGFEILRENREARERKGNR